MSLAEKLAEPVKDRGGRKCALCLTLPDLEDKEREAIEAALQPDSGWAARPLARVLQEEVSEDIKKSTIENHRREHLA